LNLALSKETAGQVLPDWLRAPNASIGYTEVVEMLIAKGANVSAKTNDGRTPLSLATKRELRKLLREHGGGKRKRSP